MGADVCEWATGGGASESEVLQDVLSGSGRLGSYLLSVPGVPNAKRCPSQPGVHAGDARGAEGDARRDERGKSGGRGMRDELVYERWGVRVGHGVLGGGDGGESICFR